MNIITITSDNVTETPNFLFVTEASDLGLPVGQFPARLPTTLGNGIDFILHHGDEQVVEYRQPCGCITLHVFND